MMYKQCPPVKICSHVSQLSTLSVLTDKIIMIIIIILIIIILIIIIIIIIIKLKTGYRLVPQDHDLVSALRILSKH